MVAREQIRSGGGARPAPPAGERPYLRELDMVRWLTCIGVVATHSLEIFGKTGNTLFAASLGSLESTREVFFLLSALVLTYRYWDRRPFPWREYYVRRILWVLIPYLIWTGIYFGMSYPHPGSFSLIAHPHGPWKHQVHLFLNMVYKGTGHLYFVAVILRFYLIFPLVLFVLRFLSRVHPLVVVASIAVQVWLMGRVSESPAINREIWNYQMYLVIGAIVGARFGPISAWLTRYRRWLLVLVAAVIVATELYTVHSIHGGTSYHDAADPFQVRYFALNLSVALGFYLLGVWCFARRRVPLLEGTVKAGSANSFGVYLSQGVYFNLLEFWNWKHVAPAHVGWEAAVLLIVALVWSWAAAVSTIFARTPLARVMGRARRPVWGSPATGRFEPATDDDPEARRPDCQRNLSLS